MDLKAFTSAITQISEEKGIPQEVILETIETAIAAAYKKDYGQRGQMVRVDFNIKTGSMKFFQLKLVVDESILREEKEEDEDESPSSEDSGVPKEEPKEDVQVDKK